MAFVPEVYCDKALLEMLSVVRTLAVEMVKAGSVGMCSILSVIDETVIAYKEHGDVNRLSDGIDVIAQHFFESRHHLL